MHGVLPINLHQWPARLIGDASVEVTVRDKDAAKVLSAHLPRGARVHVTCLSNAAYGETVAQAKALATAGFEPVPHIAARSLRNRAELDDFVARLVGEAGAARVLLVAGDLDPPRGSFAASMDVLRTGVLEARGVRNVSFAVHPEGHPSVAAETMEQALADKLSYAEQHGLGAELVSQFCFESASILACLRKLRSRGLRASVRIGAAAPTSAARLMRYALRCGVGPSLRALENHATRFGEMLAAAGPEALVDEVAAGLGAEDLGAVAGMHFFVFGDVRLSAEWLQNWRAVEHGDFERSR